MVRILARPRTISAAGAPPKNIQEYVGRLASGTDDVSIARMVSPAGWSEPHQQPAFDEYSFVLSGTLKIETAEGPITVRAGEVAHVPAGERVAYATPEGAEYIAICRPAFDPAVVNREETPAKSEPGCEGALVFEVGGAESLERIGPLWEGLARHHVDRAEVSSSPFVEEMAGKTFAARLSELREKNRDRLMRVELVASPGTGAPIGYCVTSASEGGVGEVESIFVDHSYRCRGVGSALLRHAIDWMEAEGVTDQMVSVFASNEDALPFYARHGFHPRFHLLIRRRQ
jgi:GNAT superfamily N-acetyltransferase/quercetin dioxygenase-like cupin family protein